MFETVEELHEELGLYLLYYDTARPHQGLGGKTPLQSLQDLSTNYYRNDGHRRRRLEYQRGWYAYRPLAASPGGARSLGGRARSF